jgi:hypothetical protein
MYFAFRARIVKVAAFSRAVSGPKRAFKGERHGAGRLWQLAENLDLQRLSKAFPSWASSRSMIFARTEQLVRGDAMPPRLL